jgi:hypothetical protein
LFGFPLRWCLLPHLALVLFALLRIGEIAADNKSQSVIIQLLPALKVNIIIHQLERILVLSSKLWNLREWLKNVCQNCREWFDLIDFWCFSTTFSNILAISWRPVLVVEEATNRRRFAPGFANYKKGTLDSQPLVIKFTSCLPRVGGSLRLLRFHPPLKLVAMIR